jgi:nucleotide-binding universal stress UspA family protein
VPDVERVEGDVEAAGRSYLEGLGLEAELVILRGSAREELTRYAETERIDLVVIASHGRSGLKRFALGSVAEHILRHSSTPVLLVPARD